MVIMKVYSLVEGTNSELIKVVSSMYIKDGDIVADVTYGKGVFWKQVDTSKFTFLKSDLMTIDTHLDFRNLPYKDKSLTHFVLDPPYMHTPGKPMVDERYKNSATTKKMYHTDIITELYIKGMKEGKRTLKENGFLWVKCQDEVESGYQRWSHVEIYDAAISMGFYGKDLFILRPPSNPGIQHKTQKHARKNHSYLWIFQKIPQKTYDRLVERGIISKYR